MIVGVITSWTRVLSGSRLPAVARTVISRSVSMPTRWSLSPQTGTEPTLRLFILWAATVMLSWGRTHSTPAVITSFTRINHLLGRPCAVGVTSGWGRNRGQGWRFRSRFGNRAFHCQDRARGTTHDLFSHAAHQEPTQPGSPVCAHDNQVRALLASNPEDFGRGVSLLQPALHPHIRVRM